MFGIHKALLHVKRFVDIKPSKCKSTLCKMKMIVQIGKEHQALKARLHSIWKAENIFGKKYNSNLQSQISREVQKIG